MRSFKMVFQFLLFTLFFLGAYAVAQAVAPTVPPIVPPVTDSDFMTTLLAAVGGLKGASALGIAAAVVQILLKFAGTSWGGGLLNKMSGVGKLAVVTVLTLAAGVLGLMVTGVPLGAALTHSTVLASVMVYVNQWVQQIGKQGTPT